MSKLIVKTNADPKEVIVVDIPAGNTAERLAASYGVTNADLYEEVADDAFTSDECYLRNGFDVDEGTATFALEDAKSFVSLLATHAYSQSIQDASTGHSPITLLAQFSLPSESRDPEVQTVLDNVNSEITSLAAVKVSVEAATSASGLKALVDDLPNY